MVNSYMTKAEQTKELNRLIFEKANLEYEILSFAMGGLNNRPLNDIENELHILELNIKTIRKKYF